MIINFYKIYSSRIFKIRKSNLYLSIILFLVIGSSHLFAQVSWGNPKAVPIRFMYYYNLQPGDSGVGVNGNMNNWTNGIFPMKQTSPGFWTTTLDLLPAGYEYKFVSYTDTISQSSVIQYYTDPLNPKYTGPFKNSLITVKSPMIYYLLPLDGSSISDAKSAITANVSWAYQDQIDLGKMRFILDGSTISNPQSYFDTTSRQFSYKPANPLSVGTHNVTLTVYTVLGDSAVLSTSFSVLGGGIYQAPYTFNFDSKSPNFQFLGTVKSVAIKSPFNYEGADNMVDSTGDGIYSFTKTLNFNQPYEYTYIINGGLYINDPDNPILSANHRTQITDSLNNNPHFGDFNIPSGNIYDTTVTNLNLENYFYPNDKGDILDISSIAAKLDGVPITITKTYLSTNIRINISLQNLTVGRHELSLKGKDIYGHFAPQKNYVFGIYPFNSGFHYDDLSNDDNGPGTYIYPNGIDSGSVDIKEFTVNASSGLDSLIFTIKMGKIISFTRLGFSIVNAIDNQYIPAPQNVNIQIPEWNSRGVFLTLAQPNTNAFDSTSEDILFISRDPQQTSIKIKLDTAALSLNEFKFSLPLSILQSVMGTYKSAWYFGAYSYLKGPGGVYNPPQAQAGVGYPSNPSVFDVTFFKKQSVQKRLLANYSSSSQVGGPQIARIGSDGRGYKAILPMQIDSLLGNVPDVEVFANGGDLFRDTVTVYGFADFNPGTSVTLYVGDTSYNVITDINKNFSKLVNLKEGANKIYAEVPLGNNKFSRSKIITYNHIIFHNPSVKISTSISQNSVTLNADSTVDPDGTNLKFYWTQDASNPAQVVLSGQTTSSVSFTLPSKKGEYYFTSYAINANQDTGWARAVVLVTDSGDIAPDLTKWHPAWVDSAIVYCVFVRTFDPSGTLKAVTQKIPQLKTLGINCIWLLPIYPSTGNLGPDNPGYAITDYYGILSNYGTKADLKTLIQTAHQNGIKVILDHVLNHTSDLHPFLIDANTYKAKSPYYNFYTWDQNDNYKYLFTWVDLPSVNYESSNTREYMWRMAKYWMQNFNIDGYRCDVAWGINSLRASGSMFWQEWRRELKQMKPDIFTLGEADADSIQYFNGKFNAAYDYSWFNVLKGILSGANSVDQLDSVINMYINPNYPTYARQFRYLENQDEERFITQFGVADTRIGADALLTAPGVPELYAGQEVGETSFRGNINWNDPYNLLPFYTNLIHIRLNNLALTMGNFLRLKNTNNNVYSFLRTFGNNNVIVNINFGNSAATTSINVPLNKISFDSTSSFYLNDELNNISYSVIGTDLKNYQVNLPATSAQILVLSNNKLTAIKNSDNLTNIPKSYQLDQNYPNPFNPSTVIRYALPFDSQVKIVVYNILGQKISELVNMTQTMGLHDVIWNAANNASGVYFYTIEASSISTKQTFRSVKKMILLK